MNTPRSIDVLVAGAPGLAEALRASGRFARVLACSSTSEMRDLIAKNLLGEARPDSFVFMFSPALTEDVPGIKVETLVAKLTTDDFRVVVLDTNPLAREIVRRNPAAGLFSPPFTLNTVLGGLSGTGVGLIEPVSAPWAHTPFDPADAAAVSALLSAQPHEAEEEQWPAVQNAPWAQTPSPTQTAPAAASAWGPTAAVPAYQTQEPAAPATQSPWGAEPAAPTTSSPWGAEPAAPTTPSPWGAEPAAPTTPSPWSTEPAAPTTPSPWSTEPAAPTTPSPWGAEPAAPTTSSPSPWGAEPAAPTTQSPWGAEPAAPTTSSPSPWGAEPAAPTTQSPWGAEPAAPTTPSPWGAEPAAPTTQSPWGAEPATSDSTWGGTGGWSQAAAPTQPAWETTFIDTPASVQGFGQPVLQQRNGFVIAIAVSKGGAGKSTLALNLGVWLGLRLRQSGKTVCVVDANYQQADIGKQLHRYTPNIVSLAKNPQDQDPNRISQHLLHMPNLHTSFLLGPTGVDDANPLWITPELYAHAVEVLRSLYDYIIIDTPVAEYHNEIFDRFIVPHADFIAVPVTPDIVTLQNTDNWLQGICQSKHQGGKGYDRDRVGIILNMQQDGVGMDEPEVQRSLASWHFLGSVPSSKVWQAARNEEEIVATRNYAEVNASFSRILGAITQDPDVLATQNAAPVEGKKSRWSRKKR